MTTKYEVVLEINDIHGVRSHALEYDDLPTAHMMASMQQDGTGLNPGAVKKISVVKVDRQVMETWEVAGAPEEAKEEELPADAEASTE